MILELLSVVAVNASTAAAQPALTVSSFDPASIVGALQEQGFQAKLDKDKDGDPIIKSSAGGSTFVIFFYNCKANRDCEDLQFNAAYDTDDGKGPTLEVINKWNATNRFGQAFLDDVKDPAISMDVIFTKGVMSREAFAEHLDVWVSAMGGFEKHIGW